MKATSKKEQNSLLKFPKINKKDKIKLEKLLDEGIKYLFQKQLSSGRFASISSCKKDFATQQKTFSIFPTILIGTCIADLKTTPALKNIQKNIFKHINSELSQYATLNYWERGSENFAKTPYPDDLDDTCCGLAAMLNLKPSSIDGNKLAKIVSVLTPVEMKEGGPYNTWLVDFKKDKQWKDIDLVVNSNIAYLLSLLEIKLPNIENLIEERIYTRKIESKYYATRVSCMYFISRFYQGNLKRKLIKLLLEELSKPSVNPLDLAMAISALINLGFTGEELDEKVKNLLNLSEKNLDLWKPYPLVIEKIVGKKKFYSGSAELTCAFMLEAVAKYLKNNDKNISQNSQSDEIHRKVVGYTEKYFSKFSKGSLSDFKKIIQAVIKRDKERVITTTPYLFFRSTKFKLNQELIIKLGAANLFGWVAYSIYDDFYDNEADPKFLGIANICLRNLTYIFEEILPRNNDFNIIYKKYLAKIDLANIYESKSYKKLIKNNILEVKRLPNYNNLDKVFEKSIGHVLGPVAILCKYKHKKNSTAIKKTISFYKNYILARQLSDDMHDWENDLRNGNLTYVITEVLKQSKNKKVNIEKQEEIEELQKIFWFNAVEKTCKKMKYHLNCARDDALNNPVIKNPEYLLECLIPLENACHKTLDERQKTIEFITNYLR